MLNTIMYDLKNNLLDLLEKVTCAIVYFSLFTHKYDKFQTFLFHHYYSLIKSMIYF